MDMRNPAVKNKTLLSPKDIEQIQEDPTLMEVVARAMGAVNLDNLFRTMQDPEVAPAHRIEFQKLLNKMGKLEPGNDGLAGGPQVVINITRAKDRDNSVTIEGSTGNLALEAGA